MFSLSLSVWLVRLSQGFPSLPFFFFFTYLSLNGERESHDGHSPSYGAKKMGDSNIHTKDKEPRHVEIKMHKHRRFAPEQPPAPNGVGSRSGIQQQSSHFFFVWRNREGEICVTKKGGDPPAQKKWETESRLGSPPSFPLSLSARYPWRSPFLLLLLLYFLYQPLRRQGHLFHPAAAAAFVRSPGEGGGRHKK